MRRKRPCSNRPHRPHFFNLHCFFPAMENSCMNMGSPAWKQSLHSWDVRSLFTWTRARTYLWVWRMRVNRFSGIDDPDMPSLCMNPTVPNGKMSGCGLHFTYESNGHRVFVEPGWRGGRFWWAIDEHGWWCRRRWFGADTSYYCQVGFASG